MKWFDAKKEGLKWVGDLETGFAAVGKSVSSRGFWNYILFQLLFIRLTKHEEKIVTKFDLESYAFVQGGGVCAQGKGEMEVWTWHSIQYFVVPFTGWGEKPMRHLGSPKYLQLTEKKCNSKNSDLN